MANIGFSQRRTLAYLYGWTLVVAALALALRFIPYSDDRGHFDVFWTAMMGACLVAAAAASVYVVLVLEILKLRRFRLRQLLGRPRAPAPVEAEIDAAVERELETGSFDAVDPATGEVAHLDPETGEMEAIPPDGAEPSAEVRDRPAEGQPGIG